MNYQKLKNGRYRVRIMKDGKTYSMNFPYKPSKKEALEKLNLLEIKQSDIHTPLNQVLSDYISIKSNVISPSTIASYTRIINYLNKNYPEFMRIILSDLNQVKFQQFINSYSRNHKPKTVRNVVALIKVACSFYDLSFKVNVTLPQKIKPEFYIPTDNDIRLLLQYSKDSEYYVAILLALNGLRLSEIRGLTLEDIGDGVININKAKVESVNGDVIKTTKTTSSTRIIRVDKDITDLIKKQGFIYKRSSDALTAYLRRLHNQYGLPHYSIHKLRHYWCSMMISEGVPFQYVQSMGGWSTDNVMKRVYTHALKDRDYSEVGINYLNKLKQ